MKWCLWCDTKAIRLSVKYGSVILEDYCDNCKRSVIYEQGVELGTCMTTIKSDQSYREVPDGMLVAGDKRP